MVQNVACTLCHEKWTPPHTHAALGWDSTEEETEQVLIDELKIDALEPKQKELQARHEQKEAEDRAKKEVMQGLTKAQQMRLEKKEAKRQRNLLINKKG